MDEEKERGQNQMILKVKFQFTVFLLRLERIYAPLHSLLHPSSLFFCRGPFENRATPLCENKQLAHNRALKTKNTLSNSEFLSCDPVKKKKNQSTTC